MKPDAALEIVELFGQPGAGKTTLVDLVAAETGLATNAELSAAWKTPPAFHKHALMTRALVDATFVRAAQIAVKGSLVNRDSLMRLARLVAKSGWMRAQVGALLLSEGPLQDLWSIFYSAGQLRPDPAILSPLVRSIYGQTNACIVHIDLDPETALSRISNRTHGRSRLDGLPISMLRARLTEAAVLPHRIADAARSAGLHVETLDGTQPIETLVDQLRSIVARVGVFDRGEEQI